MDNSLLFHILGKPCVITQRNQQLPSYQTPCCILVQVLKYTPLSFHIHPRKDSGHSIFMLLFANAFALLVLVFGVHILVRRGPLQILFCLGKQFPTLCLHFFSVLQIHGLHAAIKVRWGSGGSQSFILLLLLYSSYRMVRKWLLFHRVSRGLQLKRRKPLMINMGISQHFQSLLVTVSVLGFLSSRKWWVSFFPC